MPVFFFHDGNNDEVVIVEAQTLQAAEKLVDREVAAGTITADWNNAGRDEVAINDTGNKYTVKQTIHPPDASSDRVLFQVDVTAL